MRRFSLAPMSGLILGLTVVLLAIPVVFIALSLLVPWPRGAEALFGIIGLLLVVLYATVWLLWRPAAFEIGPHHLALVFPLRRREIPRDDIVATTALERGHFRERYGWALRVGVGGLWGGFGWLWTSRRGFVEMYVSRTDGIVLIERGRGRDLLITPEHPGDFIAALTGQ